MEITEDLIQDYLNEEYQKGVIIYESQFDINEDDDVIDMVCAVERFVDVDDTKFFIEDFQIDLTTLKEWSDAR